MKEAIIIIIILIGLILGISISTQIKNVIPQNYEYEEYEVQVNFTATPLIDVSDALAVVYTWSYNPENFTITNGFIRPDNYSDNTEYVYIWYTRIKK